MTTHRRPLTIAHISGELGFSGGEVQLLSLACGLSKRGHRNVVLCPDAGRLRIEVQRRGLETRPIWIRSEWSPRSVLGVRKQLMGTRPDLVFLHTGRANWIGGLAVAQLRLPAITIRRMDRPVKRDLRTRWVYGTMARRAVAISRAVRDRLLDAGVGDDTIRVIHSAVDADAAVVVRRREQLRADLGLLERTPCLLALASLVPRKGIDVLIDAVAQLRDRGLEPIALVAGEGPQRRSLERRIEQLQLSGSVRLLGQRDDVPELIDACDIVVVPSRREGLGVAALEGMAGGRPLVASSVGGLPEAVVHDETGLLVPAGSATELADALAALIADPDARQRLGGSGRLRAELAFPVDRMVRAYEDLCFEVVGEARSA